MKQEKGKCKSLSSQTTSLKTGISRKAEAPRSSQLSVCWKHLVAHPGQPPHHGEREKEALVFVQPSRKGSASSPQGSNLHMLSCRGSSSELPGKKQLSSTSAVWDQSVHTEVSSGPSMAWAAPLELANIPRREPSHHLFGAGEERGQEQPGGAARPGHAEKSLWMGGRSRVKRAGADFGARPG